SGSLLLENPSLIFTSNLVPSGEVLRSISWSAWFVAHPAYTLAMSMAGAFILTAVIVPLAVIFIMGAHALVPLARHLIKKATSFFRDPTKPAGPRSHTDRWLNVLGY